MAATLDTATPPTTVVNRRSLTRDIARRRRRLGGMIGFTGGITNAMFPRTGATIRNAHRGVSLRRGTRTRSRTKGGANSKAHREMPMLQPFHPTNHKTLGWATTCHTADLKFGTRTSLRFLVQKHARSFAAPTSAQTPTDLTAPSAATRPGAGTSPCASIIPTNAFDLIGSRCLGLRW